MRTIALKVLLAQIAVLMGTRWQDLQQDEAAQWVDALNLRMPKAWQAFHWPELRVTEQRYFYDGLWTPGPYAAGKIKYHAPSNQYWQANVATESEPNASTWTALAEPLYRFIPWEQDGQNVLGDMYSAHPEDPRPYLTPRELEFDLNADGVRILDHCKMFAWVKYRPPVPMFAGEQYVDGQQYTPGQVVYFADAGECYTCLAVTTNPPADTVPLGTAGDVILANDTGHWLATDLAHWRRMKIPEFMANMLVRGVHADLLSGDGESDKAGEAEDLYTAAVTAQMKRIVHQNHQLPQVRVRVREAPGVYPVHPIH